MKNLLNKIAEAVGYVVAGTATLMVAGLLLLFGAFVLLPFLGLIFILFAMLVVVSAIVLLVYWVSGKEIEIKKDGEVIGTLRRFEYRSKK